MRHSENALIKIGVSNNVEIRKRSLKYHANLAKRFVKSESSDDPQMRLRFSMLKEPAGNLGLPKLLPHEKISIDILLVIECGAYFDPFLQYPFRNFRRKIDFFRDGGTEWYKPTKRLIEMTESFARRKSKYRDELSCYNAFRAHLMRRNVKLKLTSRQGSDVSPQPDHRWILTNQGLELL